jgi:hypothetical protein
MWGAFQAILDSSSENSPRIKAIIDLRVIAFTGFTETK